MRELRWNSSSASTSAAGSLFQKRRYRRHAGGVRGSLSTAACWLAARRDDDLLHRVDVIGPGGGLLLQRIASGWRELVVPRSAPAFGDGPFSGDELLLRHAMERWVHRAVFDLQAAVGDGLDPLRDPEAMLRAPGERTKDQEFECALEDVEHVTPW